MKKHGGSSIKKSTPSTATTKKINKKQLELTIKNFPLWIASILFLITTLLFFWEQLIGNTFFWEDFIEQVYPIQNFAAQSFSNGEIPFWNPYTFCGMPFFADLQVGFFYPLNRLLGLFINSNGSLSVWGLQFIIILHFFIAQFTMYLLMRFFKVSSFGSTIASISFAFSLALVMHVIHPMMIYHLAWFPLVIMLFLKGLNKRKINYAIKAGLVFGLSMLAGHPQTMLYEALFLGLLFLWYLIASLKKKEIKGREVMIYIAAGLLPFIISVGIFTVQYLPSQQLADYSKRSESTFEAASEGSLEFVQIYTAIVPKLFGFVDGANDKSVPYHLDNAPYYYYWDTAFYFGIVALVLGLFGALSIYKTRHGAFLIAISIFGFLFALGDNFILFELFYNLPYFGLLRIPARIMFFVVIAFSILAGFGFDALWEKQKQSKFFKNILIASSIPLLVAILTSSGVMLGMLDTPEQLQTAIQGFGVISLVFVIAVIIISLLLRKSILKPEAAGAILIILIIIDLYIAGASFNSSPKNPEESFKIDPQLKEVFSPKYPNDLFRVSMRHYSPSYMAMMRNQGMIDNIMLVEGYNQLVFNHIPPPSDVKTIHDLYNVKFEIAFNQSTRQFNFVQRQGYYPRAWLVHKVHIFQADEVKEKMKNSVYNYLHEVILEDDIDIKLSGKIDVLSSDNVECIEYKNNYMKYNVSSSETGIVVFSEIWYPAWKVYIDGEEAELLKANYSFRAVAVPKGEHIIEIKYESDKFIIGSWMSLITLLGSIIALGVIRIRVKFSGK